MDFMTTPDIAPGQGGEGWPGTIPAFSRFAPSPTGALHLGHAWSAVLAHDAARQTGGRFLLRIEDIDTTRCRASFVDSIVEDLRWLGLAWDGAPVVQSQRRTAHDQALARLDGMGLTYPCFCTRADIAAAGGAPHGPGAAYPGTCRVLDPADRRARAAAQPHAVRLDVVQAAAMAGPLAWHDALAGWQNGDPRTGGDIVLARRDIGVGYALAVVVDDAHQGITHVVRGRDLFAATAVQRLLHQLLGLPRPRYLHHPLLLSADGRRLAKRDRAETLGALRRAGVSGLGLAKLLRDERVAGADRFLPIPATRA